LELLYEQKNCLFFKKSQFLSNLANFDLSKFQNHTFIIIYYAEVYHSSGI